MLGETESLRDAARESQRFARRLAAAFLVLAALAFGVIVLGSLVRAQEAGLACPDWPLCFGQLIPRMNLKIAFEWTHRAAVACLATSFGLLALAALRRPATRAVTAALLAAGAVLLAVQVVLGALTVWLLLADWTVTAHLVTGNAFGVCLLLTACALRELAGPSAPRTAARPAALAWIALAAALLAFQMVLGGLVASRFAGLACPEWPTCYGGAWFPSWRGPVGLHLLHRTNGYALLAALLAAALAARREPVLRALTLTSLCLGVAQIGVGIANVRLGIPFEVTGAHSALAAGLVLSLALTAREAWLRRPTRARPGP